MKSNFINFLILWIMLFVFFLRNHCLTQCCKDFFFPVFFQRFYNLKFKFRPLIHFQLTFEYSLRYGLIFTYGCHFLQIDVQILQHHLLKRLSFLYCIVLAPVLKISYCLCGLFLCSLLVQLTYVSILLPISYCRFIVSLEIRQGQSFYFVLLKIILAILSDHLLFHILYKISLSISTKSLLGFSLKLYLSIWRKFSLLIHKDSMHSIYLGILLFLHSVFFSLQHTSFADILLGLSLSIPCFGCYLKWYFQKLFCFQLSLTSIYKYNWFLKNILFLHPEIWLMLLKRSSSFLVDSLGFSVQTIISSENINS